MPGALGPRFALEAGFLILLAVVLGFADLDPLLIILIMGLAWVLVSLIEYFAWRQGPRFPTRYAAAVGPALEQEEIVVEEPAPTPVAPPPPPPPPPEEQTIVASEAPPAVPEAGSAEESIEQADERVDRARLAFAEEGRRTRYRLEPLQPRPRRRFGLFGRRESSESSREEER
jgi:hypothetical protein